MQASKATLCIASLFTSMDLSYNNSLNTEVQKQNKTQIKKLRTQVLDAMVFGISGNTFFQ